MRTLLVGVGCVLAGLAAGAIWTWAQADRYRAEARVLVRPPGENLPAIEALAESSLVEQNVAQTLRLSSPPRVSAARDEGGIVTVSVEAGSRERARQIDAEAVVILTQKIPQRFAGATGTVLDPAHVTEQTSPTPGRNLLITGLAGLAAALAAAAALWPGRRPAAAATGADPRAERRLQRRIDQVAKRERALAQRAGQLAAREKELERRSGELEARPPLPAPAPEPEPEPKPEPEPEPAVAPEPAQPGAWTLAQLEHYVSEAGPRFPERVEEWQTYLFFLREHAAIDGTLPATFYSLIADVYGDAFRR